MNPNYGYQLYQAERTQTRAEILSGDTRRGQAAAASARRARRARRGTARKPRAGGILALSIIAGRTARTAARPA